MTNLNDKPVLLLVDDIEDNLFVIQQLIQTYLPECKVITTQSAEEGLKIASKIKLDGAILDVQMPGMNGIEMCRFLKAHEHTSQIPVILITAHHTTAKIKADGLEAGADDFLSKPIDNHELIAKIKVMLRIKKAEHELRILNEQLNERVRERAKELKESEKRFRDISENALEWIWETDDEGKFTYSNSIAENMLGYTVEEVLNKTIYDFICSSNCEEIKNKICEIHSEKISFRNLLACVTHKNGTVQWLLINGIPLFDKNNELAGYRGSCIDITETKKAEEELRKSEKKFRTLSKNIPGMIYRGRSDWSVEIIINSEYITGYKDEEFYSEKINWIKLIHKDDKDRVLKEGQELIKNPLKIIQEYRIMHKDGSIRWVEDYKTSVFEKDIFLGIDGVLLDITERKKLRSQLIYAQKMEIIGQLSGGLAHDFNNIVTAIVGHSFILKRALQDNILVKNVDHILTSTKKASDLISSLLTFSKKKSGEHKSIYINKIVTDIEKLLHDIISEKINFKIMLSEKELEIKGDSGQIEQLLMNLITNARHAILETGDIIVKTQEVDLDNHTVESYGYKKAGKYVLLSVKDTGAGIDEKIITKIFDPFFTAKKGHKGTGLGLAMVYWIVKQHTGMIKVESELGKGTEFLVYFPSVLE